MSKARAWLVSLRLRTLPLALACTGMGCFLAAGFRTKSDFSSENYLTDNLNDIGRLCHGQTCLLIFFTAILLQILSNLANDYGDYKSGADNEERIGPQRALQSGGITISAMRNVIFLVAFLTLISGCTLLYLSIGISTVFLVFFMLGLLCIAAAMKYTMGKKPYGYSGLGDISVFIFFGIVAVAGAFYLNTKYFNLDILLPSFTLGFLSTGVLNVNNMRDINTDAATGKNTLVVKIGLAKAKIYHMFLVVSAFGSLIIFTLLHYNSPWQWTFLLTVPLFVLHLKGVMKSASGKMDKYLKQLAIATLVLVLFYGISIVLNPFTFYQF